MALKTKYPEQELMAFITYCDDVLLENNTDWLLPIITPNLPKEDLLKDIETCLTKYYIHIKYAQEMELYHFCAIMMKAKAEEIKHYQVLGKVITKKSIRNDINAIETKLKTKYLY